MFNISEVISFLINPQTIEIDLTLVIRNDERHPSNNLIKERLELNEVLAEKFFEKSRFSKIVSQVMLDQIIRHKNELKTVAKKALKANSQHTSEQVVFFVYTEIKIERLR